MNKTPSKQSWWLRLVEWVQQRTARREDVVLVG